MKKHKKLRNLLCVTICLILMLPNFAFGSSITDVKGHWAEAQIVKWVNNGYIKSYGDGTFKPDNPITRAEFMAIVNRAFGFKDIAQSLNYKDIKKTDWFYEDVAKAVKAGYMNGCGGNMMLPGSSITNQEVAVVISKLLKLSTPPSYDLSLKFKDTSDISSWSLDAVKAVASMGYMKGYNDLTFKPTKPITRAEAVAVLDSCYLKHQKKAFYKSGIYSEGTVEGSILIGTRAVTLKDTVINGDLILTEDIGDGDIHLKNVTVKGNTIIKGGGMNSIYIEDSSLTRIVIIKVDNKVRVVATGNSRIDNVSMQSGAKLEEQGVTGAGFGFVTIAEETAENASIILSGSFENVQLLADNVDVSLISGNIASFNISQQGGASNINIAAGSTVTNMILNAPANVTGGGSIQSAQVNAAGSTLGIRPANITNPGGVSITLNTPTAPSSSPAGSGGSSGGGRGGSGEDGESSNPKVEFTAISSRTVEKGNTLTLKIYCVPTNAIITANSENTEVAAVELSGSGSGSRLTITGVSEGTCKISLTGSKNGYVSATTSFNVTVVPKDSGDITSPELVSVEALSSLSIKLTFDEELDKTSAETAANYSVDKGIGYASSAILSEDKKSVEMTLPYHLMKNIIYKVSVYDVEDLNNNKCSGTRSFTSTFDIPEGYIPPKLSSLEVLSYSSIKLVFDKELEKTSAENKENYKIDNGMGTVSTAVLEADKKTVILTLPYALQKGKAYKLSILNVADRSGNKCSIIRTFYSRFDVPEALVPPKLLSLELINDTTLRVRFDEELEKTSAETISNYYIDNGIGNPLTAVLGDDGTYVILTIPKLAQGIRYYMTVSNVRDTDGNRMLPATKGIIAMDTTMPMLESATACFNNELRLEFDEAVKAEADARVVVSYGDVKKYADLKAVGGTAVGDGHIIVFKANKQMSDGESEGQPEDFSGSDFLMENINYTIESVSYISDLSNNRFNLGEDDGISFIGSSEANDKPEVIASELINGKTLRVVFSEPILSPGGTIVSKDASATVFNVSERDPDYNCNDDGYSTIDLTAGTLLTRDTYSFDFSAVPGLTDFCGTPVKDVNDGEEDDSGYTDLIAGFEDVNEPVIEYVEAVNNKTIHVKYTEPLSYPGAYKITYFADGSERTVLNSAILLPEDQTTVKISTVEELSEDLIYTLIPIVGAKDLSGNIAEVSDVSWDFQGTNVDGDYIQGVSVENGKLIRVRTTAPIDTASGDTIKVYNSADANEEDMIESISGMGTIDLTISLKSPLLEEYYYLVETTGEVNDTYLFSGVISDGGIDIDQNGIITFSGWDAENYVVYVVYDRTPHLIVPETPASEFNASSLISVLDAGEECGIEVYRADTPHAIAEGKWASPYGEYGELNQDGFVKGSLIYYKKWIKQ